MLWGDIDQVVWVGMAFQLEATIQYGQKDRKRKRSDRPEETGWEDKGGYLVSS